MQLRISENNNQLIFEEVKEEKDSRIAPDVKFTYQGFWVRAEDEETGEHLASLNLCDGSIFYFNNEKARELVGLWGGKRWPGFSATNHIDFDEEAKKENFYKLIYFPRDISFSLKAVETFCTVKTVSQYLKSLEDYENLVKLFKNCANFTPAKQKEFTLENMFCRFNKDNPQSKNPDQKAGTFSVPMFFFDKDQFVGTITADVHYDKEGKIAVYFRDEVVDWSLGMDADKKNRAFDLIKLIETTQDETLKKEYENEFVELVEPFRKPSLKKLFIAAQAFMRQKLCQEFGLTQESLNEKMANGQLIFWMRAAAGREEFYKEALECGVNESEINKKPYVPYVIHGDLTELARELVNYFENRAIKELNGMQSSPSQSGRFAKKKSEELSSVVLEQDKVSPLRQKMG